jgi:outer membrane lipoprotein carrier protein
MRQQIQQVARTMKTMQCDFVQTKQLKLLNDQLVSKGRMYYQQSNKLRWEYVSPYTYTFILNDSQVLLKNSQRNDVIDVNQNRLFKEIARLMMNSVVGSSLTDDKDFHVALKAEGGEWVATLQPKSRDMRQLFQLIRLHFDKTRKVVTRVELVEKKGDTTTIDLKNVRTNEPIPAETFAVR